LRGGRQVLKLDHALFMPVLELAIDGASQPPFQAAIEQFFVGASDLTLVARQKKMRKPSRTCRSKLDVPPFEISKLRPG